MITSHTNPATQNNRVSVVLYRTPMKIQATKLTLVTAIAMARTILNSPNSKNEAAEVAKVRTISAAQTATSVPTFGI